MSFEPVIGLEIHAQLRTETKIFCGCRNAFGAPPNTDVCPVCLGLPGALPVLNARAVEFAVRAALALNCAVHERSDLRAQELFLSRPAQGLSDFAVRRPLATGGWMDLRPRRRRAPRRHHAAPSGGGRRQVAAPRLRGLGPRGVPGFQSRRRAARRDRHGARPAVGRRRGAPASRACATWSSRSASTTATWRRAACAATRTSRCGPPGSAAFGTKTEIKNVNSFRFVQKALEFEIARQTAMLAARRERPAGNAALGRRPRRDAADARQGRGARLPLFSGAGPAAARS